MPAVSVIIPNYNHASFLTERIESVLQQEFTDFEIIILDDASTDDSRSVIEKYRSSPFVKEIIYNAANSGQPYRQWQRGLEKATGDWIWIAESDDTAESDFLTEMTAFQKKEPSADILYCDSRMVFTVTDAGDSLLFSAIKNKGLHTTKWSHAYHSDGPGEINEALKWTCTINNASAVLFRREPLVKAIQTVKDFRYHGDWMLYLQMAISSHIAYLPKPLNNYREHAANHSKSPGFRVLSKVEHFSILNFLMQQDFVMDKKKLIRHFSKEYCGFGFIREKGFSKDGAYPAFKKINPVLARKVLFNLVLHKLKLV